MNHFGHSIATGGFLRTEDLDIEPQSQMRTRRDFKFEQFVPGLEILYLVRIFEFEMTPQSLD